MFTEDERKEISLIIRQHLEGIDFNHKSDSIDDNELFGITDKEVSMKLPMQPLHLDENGTVRFKTNKIVKFLLDNGGVDMNQLAIQGFSQEDRVQFAQLIGYSLGGFSSLSYVDDDTYYAAEKVAKDGGLI